MPEVDDMGCPIAFRLGGLASLWWDRRVEAGTRSGTGRGTRACVWEQAPNYFFERALESWAQAERGPWRNVGGALPANWCEGAEDRAFWTIG